MTGGGATGGGVTGGGVTGGGQAGWRGTRSRGRVVVMAVVGIAVALVVGGLGHWVYAPLLGWDAATVVFGVWVWAAISRMDAAATRAHATREDPTRASSDLIVLFAAVASLVAVGFVLVEAASAKGSTQALLAGLGVTSVALSWVAIHTLFTLRYALLYFQDPVGGIDFNQDEPPRYTDFAYVAFTLGMTYQVSDTDLRTHQVRASALRHALLSYVFGALIIATAVNLVVSLASSGGG